MNRVGLERSCQVREKPRCLPPYPLVSLHHCTMSALASKMQQKMLLETRPYSLQEKTSSQAVNFKFGVINSPSRSQISGPLTSNPVPLRTRERGTYTRRDPNPLLPYCGTVTSEQLEEQDIHLAPPLGRKLAPHNSPQLDT